MTTEVTIRERREVEASTPWLAVAEAFLDCLDSELTRKAYRRHIGAAFRAIDRDALADVTGADLAAYRKGIVSSGLSPAWQSQALAAVRSFLRWARLRGAHSLPSEVVAEALRTPKNHVQRPYNVLGETEVAEIIAAATTPRDRALLAVLLGGGLRVSEVVALDVGDVFRNQDGRAALYVRQGKGRKDRIVSVGDEVGKAVDDYLGATGRHPGSTGPLFRAHDRGARSRSRRRLSARAVDYLVKTTARRAGIDAKRISPHSLRHTYAIRSLRAGGNVVAISRLLGHASIATTQRYVDHLEIDELREAVPPLPGMAT